MDCWLTLCLSRKSNLCVFLSLRVWSVQFLGFISVRDSGRAVFEVSAMAAEKLRDLSQPIDVGLLDATVAAFYGTGSKEEVCYFFLFSSLHCFLFVSR